MTIPQLDLSPRLSKKTANDLQSATFIGWMSGSGPPFRRAATPKGSSFWKPSFIVVAWNSSWYCHNQTTDHNPNPNPNRIPNRKLSLLEMAENGGPFGMAALRNGGPTPSVPLMTKQQFHSFNALSFRMRWHLAVLTSIKSCMWSVSRPTTRWTSGIAIYNFVYFHPLVRWRCWLGDRKTSGL